MRVTLESTSRIVTVENGGHGAPGRVWEGTSESGVRVFAVITRIAADRGPNRDADLSQFEAELESCARKPSAESSVAIPNRLVL